MKDKKQELKIRPNTETQVIYADKIINFSAGPAVSKLTLGMDAGPESMTPTITLILPTLQFFEAIQHISNSINNDANLIDQLNSAMDAARKHYSEFLKKPT